jgi:hypothetical protein
MSAWPQSTRENGADESHSGTEVYLYTVPTYRMPYSFAAILCRLYHRSILASSTLTHGFPAERTHPRIVSEGRQRRTVTVHEHFRYRSRTDGRARATVQTNMQLFGALLPTGADCFRHSNDRRQYGSRWADAHLALMQHAT